MSDPHGTPAATDDQDHAEAAHAAASGHDDAGHDDAGHGHDEHGHGGMALGPIDWRMWGVGVVGVAVALIVTAGFVVATSFQFNA